MASFFVRTLFQFYILSVCFCDDFDRSNRFAVKVNKSYKGKIKETIQSSEFSWLAEITPETFVVEYKGLDDGYKILQHLSELYKNEIIAWERIRVYENTLKPADISTQDPPLSPPNLVCDKYYGMGIEEAWQLGFTGKNVIVAITDVGVNTDLSDLKNQINVSLSKNFVKNNTDVTPEDFPFMEDRAAYYTDHGNRVASVVAAEKHNGICSAGIAFNATIAVLKIYEVQMSNDKYQFQLLPAHWTASDIVAEAFVHKMGQIDVFVNAWSTEQMFDPLDLLTAEAIKHGATDGRGGKGTIYLVPAGPAGNGLSNNIYTVTVGSVGRFGTKPQGSFIDASVITSGLSDGNNITSYSLVTSSKKNKCISSFKGLSAATAQIAGIIALGLDANPSLTLRDILHLLVKASDHKDLESEIVFKQNGAGKYFHEIFGFGLLNASVFVKLARSGIYTSPMFSNTLQETSRDKQDKFINIDFCFHCSKIQDVPCVTAVEYVVVSLDLETDTSYLKISVISPYNTESVLMSESLKQDELKTVIHGNFVSSHFWNESPVGVWQIRIEYRHKTDQTEIKDAKITFYGTHRKEHAIFARQSYACQEDILQSKKVIEELGLKNKAENSENPSVEGLYNFMYVISALFLLAMLIIIILVCKRNRHTLTCPCNRKAEPCDTLDLTVKNRSTSINLHIVNGPSGSQSRENVSNDTEIHNVHAPRNNHTAENEILRGHLRNNNRHKYSVKPKALGTLHRLNSIDENDGAEIYPIDNHVNYSGEIVSKSISSDTANSSLVFKPTHNCNLKDKTEHNENSETDEDTFLLQNDSSKVLSNKDMDSKDDSMHHKEEERDEKTPFLKSESVDSLLIKNNYLQNEQDDIERERTNEEAVFLQPATGKCQNRLSSGKFEQGLDTL